MKPNSIPRNELIPVRVTTFEKFEFKQIAASNNLSVSEWANIILKNNKNRYGIQDDHTNYIIAIKDTIEVLESTIFKIEERESKIPGSIYKKVDLFFLGNDLFMKKEELRQILNRLRKSEGVN